MRAIARVGLGIGSSWLLGLSVGVAPASAAIVSSTEKDFAFEDQNYDLTFWYDSDGGSVTWGEVKGKFESPLPSFLWDLDQANTAFAFRLGEEIVATLPTTTYDPVASSGFVRGFRVPFLDSSGALSQIIGDVNGFRGKFGLGDNQSTSYSWVQVAPTAVPTPALLPGLIGMGLATIRKRKQAHSEQA